MEIHPRSLDSIGNHFNLGPKTWGPSLIWGLMHTITKDLIVASDLHPKREIPRLIRSSWRPDVQDTTHRILGLSFVRIERGSGVPLRVCMFGGGRVFPLSGNLETR